MRINIDPSNIPFEMKLKSKNKIFRLVFKHFITNDCIYLDMLNEKGYYLIENERLFVGRPINLYLMKDENKNLNSKFPQAYIVPMTKKGEEIPVTYENLGKKVFLEYYELDEKGNVIKNVKK